MQRWVGWKFGIINNCSNFFPFLARVSVFNLDILCSKGCQNKEAVTTRLECPAKIMDDLEEMRDDFILNKKSQMLVMVSIATDEMI